MGSRGVITQDQYETFRDSINALIQEYREKAFILLTKEIMKLSNRRMAYELPLFGIDRIISYKTVERLYSDPLVIMILNNIFIETLRKKEMGEM